MSQREPDTFLPLTPLWFNILLAVADVPRHGYAIIKEIEERTEGALTPASGTVYLALQRLLEDGLIEEVSGAADQDARRGRTYDLTSLGRRVTELEARRIAAELGVAMDKDIVDASVLSR